MRRHYSPATPVFLMFFMTACCLPVLPSHAAPEIWVTDANGKLGKVDVQTKAVTTIGTTGIPFTDIAFSPQGDLWGVTFQTLYRINKSTAAVSVVAAAGISNMNALVFDSSGQLFVAESTSTLLYTLNTSTGAATLVGDVGHVSAGDLAFLSDGLYESDANGNLVKITVGPPLTSSTVGPFGFTGVFGLASPDGQSLYGASGSQVLAIDRLTGAATSISNLSSLGFGTIFGAAFATESAAPEPATLLSFAAGLPLILRRRYRRAYRYDE